MNFKKAINVIVSKKNMKDNIDFYYVCMYHLFCFFIGSDTYLETQTFIDIFAYKGDKYIW